MNARMQRRPRGRYLEHRSRLRVRFHEVDALRIVWHGHYVSYFELGREAFGRAYGLGYEEMIEAGLAAPVVRLGIDYLLPARYGDELEVCTRLFERESAKLEIGYEVRRLADGALLAKGWTVQAFTDLDGKLVLTMPGLLRSFYLRFGGEMVEADAAS